MQGRRIRFALMLVIIATAGVFFCHARVGPFSAVHGPVTALMSQRNAAILKAAMTPVLLLCATLVIAKCFVLANGYPTAVALTPPPPTCRYVLLC